MTPSRTPGCWRWTFIVLETMVVASFTVCVLIAPRFGLRGAVCSSNFGHGSCSSCDACLAVPFSCEPLLFAFIAGRRARWLDHRTVPSWVFCDDVHMTQPNPGDWIECGRAMPLGDSCPMGRPDRSVFSMGIMKPLLRSRFGILVIGVGIFVVLGITGIELFSRLLPGPCVDEVISEVPSPDGKLKVVVFERDAGATTDFSTQASIIGINQKLKNEAGNVFARDSVVLSFHGKARVFRKESEVRGVRVSYSYLP